MISEGQFVILQARVVDDHDRSNVVLTVDDAVNARDARENHFVLSKRALEVAMERAAGRPDPESSTTVGVQTAAVQTAAEPPTATTPKLRGPDRGGRRKTKAVEAP